MQIVHRSIVIGSVVVWSIVGGSGLIVVESESVVVFLYSLLLKKMAHELSENVWFKRCDMILRWFIGELGAWWHFPCLQRFSERSYRTQKEKIKNSLELRRYTSCSSSFDKDSSLHPDSPHRDTWHCKKWERWPSVRFSFFSCNIIILKNLKVFAEAAFGFLGYHFFRHIVLSNKGDLLGEGHGKETILDDCTTLM